MCCFMHFWTKKHFLSNSWWWSHRNMKLALRPRSRSVDSMTISCNTNIPGIPRCTNEPECWLSHSSAVVLTLINMLSLSYQLQSVLRQTHTDSTTISATANGTAGVMQWLKLHSKESITHTGAFPALYNLPVFNLELNEAEYVAISRLHVFMSISAASLNQQTHRSGL